MRKFISEFNIFLAILLLLGVSVSVITMVNALTPNPGHPWSEIGDGTFSVAGPTAMRTFTFPDTDATIATVNSAINAQTGTAYTLQASDNGKVITFDNSSNITLTVPAGLGAGFSCLIVELGTGTITPTAAGTTINQRQSLTKTAGRYAIATLIASSLNTFVLSGDLQ